MRRPYLSGSSIVSVLSGLSPQLPQPFPVSICEVLPPPLFARPGVIIADRLRRSSDPAADRQNAGHGPLLRGADAPTGEPRAGHREDDLGEPPTGQSHAG